MGYRLDKASVFLLVHPILGRHRMRRGMRQELAVGGSFFPVLSETLTETAIVDIRVTSLSLQVSVPNSCKQMIHVFSHITISTSATYAAIKR